MKILVTGGCGYIGHYVVGQLLDKGFEVIVVDDLSTGFLVALDRRATFYQVDIRNIEGIEKIFSDNDVALVIDFAARLVVEDSIVNPMEYYDVNVNGLKVILDSMVKYDVKNIIFSSTAAVHGLLDKDKQLINEEDPTIPSNTYGETKLTGERMIKWYSEAYELNYIIFRYFNVVGGNKPGANLDSFTTIVPRMINSIKNNKALFIFGNDYNTPDGTCIRDYIHVYDLVDAHIITIEKFNKMENGIYNLSVGKGVSLLELISTTSKCLNKTVNYTITNRRIGDPVISVATNEKFVNATNWEPKYDTIEKMVKEAYESWVD